MASDSLKPSAFPDEAGPRAGPLRPKAVQELFRRWPRVPTRELERIRSALLQWLQKGHQGREHRLSDPARSLLWLITAELARTRGGAG